MKTIFLLVILITVSVASFAGQIFISGEAGPSQLFSRVYAFRCESENRGSCGSQGPIIIELNQKTEIDDGIYLFGFENSVYPELVRIQGSQMVQIFLVKLTVPTALKKMNSILVSRNFAQTNEMEKYYWSLHLLKKPMFRLSLLGTSGLYLSGAHQREVVQRLTYDYCEKSEKVIAGFSEDAQKICEAWNSQTISRISEIIKFNSDNQGLSEQWVTHPGDITRVDHLRHLVSAPIKGNEFVSVFPGSYRFTSEKDTVVVRASIRGQ